MRKPTLVKHCLSRPKGYQEVFSLALRYQCRLAGLVGPAVGCALLCRYSGQVIEGVTMQKASAGLTPEPTTTTVSIESQIIMEATGMVRVVSFFLGLE